MVPKGCLSLRNAWNHWKGAWSAPWAGNLRVSSKPTLYLPWTYPVPFYTFHYKTLTKRSYQAGDGHYGLLKRGDKINVLKISQTQALTLIIIKLHAA